MTELDYRPQQKPLEEQIGGALRSHIGIPGVDRGALHDRLNGKATPNIAENVFDMTSLPGDALLHPGFGAIARREQQRFVESVGAEKPASTLPPQAEVYRAPRTVARRPQVR